MAQSTLKRGLTFTVTSALLLGGALGGAGCASTPEVHANPGPTESGGMTPEDKTEGETEGTEETEKPLTEGGAVPDESAPIISNPAPVPPVAPPE